MFDKITERIISFMTAAVMATSNVMPLTSNIAEENEPDLTYQSMELYPNGEEAEQIVTLDGMMPEGAEAEVVDVSAEHEGIVAYDITIKDGWKEYQPDEENPIKVEITDPVITESVTLWHICDDGTKEQIIDFDVEDGKISFFATGFSVYEIVDAIAPINITYDVETLSGESEYGIYEAEQIGENGSYVYPVMNHYFPGVANKIKNLDDFKAHVGEGVYISTNQKKFYAMNSQDNNVRNSKRTGIAAYNAGTSGTDDSRMQAAYNNGASMYYFEPVNPNDENNVLYRIYTYADDQTTPKYVGHNPNKYSGNYNRIYLTNDTNNSSSFTDGTYTAQTEWTVEFNSYNNNGCFSFKDDTSYGSKIWYLCEAPIKDSGTHDGIAAWNAYDSTTTPPKWDAGANFNLWLYEPLDEIIESDPYDLNGKSFGLVSYDSATKGYAMLAGAYRGNATLGSTDMTRFTEGAVSYSSPNGYGISGWTFHWVSDTKYKISAIADNGNVEKYLKLDDTGLILVNDASQATELEVVPNSDGRIKLVTDEYGIRYNSSAFKLGTKEQASQFDLVDISSNSEDTLGLSGNTYKLICQNNYAMQATPKNETQLNNQQVAAITNSSNETEYLYFGELSDWTFEWVDGNRYIISSSADGSTKYLKLQSSGLTLSNTEYILTVVEGTETNDNKIKIYNTSDRYMIYGASAGTSTLNNDANRFFALATTTSAPTSDQLGLNGKTYGLVAYDAANSKGIALNSKTELTYDADHNKYINTSSLLPGWTFHWEGENKYTLTNSEGKYLKSDLSAGDTAQVFAIVTDGNAIAMYNPENTKVLSWNTSGSKFDFQSASTTLPHLFHLVDLTDQPADPYGLDGRSYGLMYYQNGTYGYTMQAEANNTSTLKNNPTETRVNPLTHNHVNFVTEESDAVSFWTFKHIEDDYYELSANTDDGVKYLNITSDGKLQLSSTSQSIRVIPGSGKYAGMIQLCANGKYVKYNTTQFSAAGFDNKNPGLFWLNFVEDVSMLIPDDFIVYTAKKVGVSEREENDPSKYKIRNNEPGDTAVHNEIIIYTRVWDSTQNKYRFFAIDHDGKLVECYERGDDIMWIGSQVNSLKWTFIEYLYDDGTPTNYYDLYNPYSGNYLVPQIKDGQNGQILVNINDPNAADKLGINMPGRREGEYYTPFIKWDEDNYAFAALKANDADTAIESCTRKEGDTFYFAYFTTSNLTEVETVDNSKYGITMKMVDFNGASRSYDGCSSTVEQHNVMGRSHWKQEDALKADSAVVSTNLVDGYPLAMLTGHSLGELFDQAGTRVVNHLFIQSTLEQSGYFEYDSCQNFATLKDASDHDFGNPSQNSAGEYLFLVVENGNQVVKAYADPSDAPTGAKQIYDFRVTKELGTYDSGGNKPSLKHGQFLPYDGIDSGHYATTNGWNLYDALQNPLSDTDPRKYEQLHLIDDVDNYFGMELEASFIQTPNGKDNWGHPIVFEFTGDDDFWLYVDDELVIDLGGVHSALSGTVNFATGEVVVNGVPTTLRDIFYKNYLGYTSEEAVAIIKRLKGDDTLTLETIQADEELKAIYDRYMASHHTEAEAQQYVNKLFKQTDDDHYVFKDYTQHTMKIFYMERGAGASNLHMRFNISSVNPGSVMLTKQVETEGVTIDGELDENLLQFPYQIWFATKDVQEAALAASGITGTPTNEQIINALNAYATTHPNQMLLTPNTENFSIGYQQSARSIRFEDQFTDNLNRTFRNVFFLYPGMSADIRFPEDTLYYKIVECGIDSNVYHLTNIEGGDGNENLHTTELPWSQVSERPNVVYKNTVAQNAFKPLRITKILYDDQDQKLSAEEDTALYTFRLYLTDGISNNLQLTNMYKYHVLDPDGNYCKWDRITKKLVSLGAGNSDLTQLHDRLEEITFETSINGAISNIPAGYTVEVPNLPLHSYFMVEERADETPLGYKYLDFSDHIKDPNDSSFIPQATVTLNGQSHTINPLVDRQCAGQIPDGTKQPWVDIDNRRGWELHANKVWSDKDFVNGHANIYTAVFLKNSDNTETLLEGSIRELRSPDTEVWYYFEHLENGHTFNDYAIYEVVLGNQQPTVTENIDELRGTEYIVSVDNPALVEKRTDALFQLAYTKTDGSTDNGSYRVSYDTGTPTGGNQNVRIDSIKNTRQGGLIIKLFEMGTSTPLENGTFVLTKYGDDTPLGKYVSDKDGQVTVMYDFDLDQNYFLTETSAPKGYLGVPNTITFCVESENDEHPEKVIIVNDGDEATDWVTGHIKPTVELVAEVDVYNPRFDIKFKKVDGQGQPLEGASFSIYRCVTVPTTGAERMDYFPVSNDFDRKLSDANGNIFEISPAQNNMLLPGKYYLFEEEAPTDYIGLDKPIKFEITEKGVVKVIETAENGTETALTSNQYLSMENQTYVFTIPNQFSKRDYYFDIEKIIFVDKNIHDNDTEQKFVFKVDRFPENTTEFYDRNIQDSFYVTINCDKELTYSYSENQITNPELNWTDSENQPLTAAYPYNLHTTGYTNHAFDADSKTVTVTYGDSTTYTFPAAIWDGRKTVHVSNEGIYRISEVSGWSNTDYDFWTNSNRYKGYGDGSKGEPVITGGFRDSQTSGSSSLPIGDKNCVYINVSEVNASKFKTAFAEINGKTVYRPTASFTNTETEYAYLSSQAYADNTINRS